MDTLIRLTSPVTLIEFLPTGEDVSLPRGTTGLAHASCSTGLFVTFPDYGLDDGFVMIPWTWCEEISSEWLDTQAPT